MLPPAHIAAGMAPPFAVSAAVYLVRRGRVSARFLTAVPLWMLAGGVWAVVPDMPRLVLRLAGRQYGWSAEWHRPGWPDIFFFHGTLDSTGRGGSLWGTAAILFMFVCLVVVYLREIHRLTRQVSSMQMRAHGKETGREGN